MCARSAAADVVAKGRQGRGEPLVGGHRRTAAAPYLVGDAAQAAVAGGLIDKVLRRLDLVIRDKRVVFGAKVRLRLLRIVPSAVAKKLTAGVFDESKQMVDFNLGHRRRRCPRSGQ